METYKNELHIFGVLATIFAAVMILGLLHLDLPRGFAPKFFPQIYNLQPQKFGSLKPNLKISAGHLPPGVPVLMYHHVGDLPQNPDQVRRDLTVSSADFGAEVSLLDQLGYHSITTAQLGAWLHGQGSLPAKPIIFSFDDGYSDVFKNAVPILEQHGMTGTFAVIPGFVGNDGYADWQQLNNAQTQGMELVCHSEHHMDFTNPIYPQTMKIAEVADCKQDLIKHLGFTGTTFVYPYGHFNSDLEGILKGQGFTLAFTTAFGFVNKNQNLLELPRVRVHGSEPLEIFEKNLGLIDLKNPAVPSGSAALKIQDRSAARNLPGD